jgi:hypothetical protein
MGFWNGGKEEWGKRVDRKSFGVRPMASQNVGAAERVSLVPISFMEEVTLGRWLDHMILVNPQRNGL